MAETTAPGAGGIVSPVNKSKDTPKQRALHLWIAEADRRWKPDGFNDEMRTRHCYYNGDQERYLVEHLRRVYPNSWEEMALHTDRLTQRIVKTRAQVFGKGCAFPLVGEDGEHLSGDDADMERWSEILRLANVKAHLRTADRWAVLMNTSFVTVGWDDKNETPMLSVFAPYGVHAQLDAHYPLDLDRAQAMAFESVSSYGKFAQKMEEKFYEFWSASDPAKGHYVVDGTGERVEVPWADGRNPYADEDGPLIPVVAFRSMEPELGLFNSANQDLIRANLALNTVKTDVHYIARCQGFGQPYAERDATSPETMPATVVFGPGRLPYLPRGVKLQVLQLSPQLEALRELMEWDSKSSAVAWDVPAGSVLADSRTVASAESLVVEREPQLEAREEQAEAYREAVERLFRIIRVVNNTHAASDKHISEEATLAWQPGGGRIPFSPREEQDVDIADLKNDLTTGPRILAKRHGITLDDAKAMFEEMREENREVAEERMELQQKAMAGQRPRLAAIGGREVPKKPARDEEEESEE